MTEAIINRQNLLEYVAEGVVVTDDDTTRILYANRAAVRMLGLKRDTLSRIRLIDLVHPEDKVRVKEYYEELKKKRELVTVRRIRRNGRYRTIERDARVLPDRNIVSIIRDITDRRKSEELRNTFFSMASHELKNPITSISLYTELAATNLAKKGDHALVAEALHKISQEVKRLGNIVGDMLDLSKIQAGKFKMRWNYFDLNAAVREAVEHIVQTTDRHINIHVQGYAAKPVLGDVDKIYQVLINLLSNAVKYSPGSPSVWVRVRNENARVVVSVTDFGIGIEKKDQAKIFRKYFRAREAENTGAMGLGIGLYLCREIIKEHGGMLTVKSERRKGATFSFSLPATAVSSKRS